MIGSSHRHAGEVQQRIGSRRLIYSLLIFLVLLWFSQAASDRSSARRTPNRSSGFKAAAPNGSSFPVAGKGALAPFTGGPLIISEFRLRGPAFAQDEFIEVSNNSGADHTVAAVAGTGYGLAASDGVVRCTIPNGTLIPAGGHFLCVDSISYSLNNYPAGNGSTATGDATFTIDIPDNAGIALFNNNAGGGSFTLANRFDAVGSISAPALYREGAGLPPLTPFNVDCSFYRDLRGGAPKDTDDNASDFLFVDTNGTSAGVGQRLGAPGPENLTSPILNASTFVAALVDSAAAQNAAPNEVRDLTSDPGNNSTFGTITYRRKITNLTGQPLTRLRFRVVNITTFPAPAGAADLRARTSNDVTVSLTGGGAALVRGTTLEQPPGQPNGGGFNATLSVPAISSGSPLAPGASVNVQFLIGVQQTGSVVLEMDLCPLSPPTLGNYANTSVQLGANTTITPDAVPTGTTSINISISTSFKGKLEGNPATGVVRITNANSAGMYPVTVTALNGSGGSATKSFTLNVTTPVTCNPVTFAPAAAFSAGANPRSVAVGDFNGDGKQDLATSSGPASVSVLLGNGTGGFGATASFGTGTTPESVRVGDFNGDGKQDLVTANANFSSHNVSILLGNGTGGFSAAANFVVGFQPRSVAVGDFNGDNKQDLAVANELSDSVSVLLGDGAGGFGTAVDYAAVTPNQLVVGDFNGDGKQDLAATNRGGANNRVSVLLGDGLGAFGAATSFVVGTDPLALTVGDFNGDGKQDLATANGLTDNVSVLLGDGLGSFAIAANFAAGAAPVALAVGDLNGDGKQDLAVADSNSANAAVLLGDGAGGFSAPVNFSVGTTPASVAVGDFDADGKQDLAVGNFGSNNVSILARQCSTTNIIVVTNTNDSGAGSLRQAIFDSNATPGVQTIVFQIVGAGVRTFTPATALPDITQPVIIDGYTQPGASANTLTEGDNATLLIELNGNGGAFNGLSITGGGSTVRGLVINRFGLSGIRLSGSGGSTVEGCFIGTNPAGLTANGNGVGVAVVSSQSNIIGGATSATRNIISGNGSAGIQLGAVGQAMTLNNSILGNYIGTGATGAGALGNGVNTPTGGNGILVPANVTGAAIHGNRIAYNTGNVAMDTGNGVRIPMPAGAVDLPAVQIEITENEIFGNDGLAIDLGPAGSTPNDPLDADAGPNNLQNFPILSSFVPTNANRKIPSRTDTTFTVNGSLNSTPEKSFFIHWYFSDGSQCAPARPLVTGKLQVATDLNGNVSFSFSFTLPTNITSGVVHATATDLDGNTSELGCLPTDATPPGIQFSSSGYSVNEGAAFVEITVSRTGNLGGASTVDFKTSDDSATQIGDYVINSGTLSFAAGQANQTFSVFIVDDGYSENSETLKLTLSGAMGALLGAPSTVTVAITDNDSGSLISPAPKRFAAFLDGGQETPPNNSPAKGTGLVLLDALAASETPALAGLQFQHLSSAETMAQIHGPGAVGVPALALFLLPTTNPDPVRDFPIDPNPTQIANLKAALLYLNVSSTNFGDGEIRGQLLWNPTLEERFLVRQQYLDFLGRDGESMGFNFWVGTISGCKAWVQCFHDRTISTSDAFFFEDEFQQTAAFVFRVYRAAFANLQPSPNPDALNTNLSATLRGEARMLPSYEAFAADRARVVGGAALAQQQINLANAFVQRPEFLNNYPLTQDGPAFVDAILGTIATIKDASGMNLNLSAQKQLLNLEYLNAGGGTAGRAMVLYRLADNKPQNPIDNHDFINAEYNRQFALTLYFGYLRRNPDIGGFLFWQSQINSAPLRNVDKQNALVCSFLTAAEYQFRFGPSAPRSNEECPH